MPPRPTAAHLTVDPAISRGNRIVSRSRAPRAGVAAPWHDRCNRNGHSFRAIPRRLDSIVLACLDLCRSKRDIRYTSDGGEEFGAVRDFTDDTLVVYVENGGEFLRTDPGRDRRALAEVILDPAALDPELRDAIAHAHDAEEPGL